MSVIDGQHDRYPVYMHQPSDRTDFEAYDHGKTYAGPPNDYGPPDLFPSQLNTAAYNVYGATRGRHLAGLSGVSMDSADLPIRDYSNELNLLANEDDVSGSGVFDPPGAPQNIHADQGVFADHASIPGYIMRDRFYAPSEVIDLATGGNVMYVPGGAVAIDYAQRRAYEDTLMYEVPPEVNPWPLPNAHGVSTVIPQEAAWPIGQTENAGSGPSAGQVFAWASVIGLGVGIFAYTVWGRKKRRA